MAQKQNDYEKARLARVYYQNQLSGLLPKITPEKVKQEPIYDYSQFPVQDVLGVDLTKDLTPEQVGSLGTSLQEYGFPLGSGNVKNVVSAIQAKAPALTGQSKVPSTGLLQALPFVGSFFQGEETRQGIRPTPKAVEQTLKSIIQPKKPELTPLPDPMLNEQSLSRLNEIKKEAWDQAHIMVGEKLQMNPNLKPGDPKYDAWKKNSEDLYRYMIEGFDKDSISKYAPQSQTKTDNDVSNMSDEELIKQLGL